MPKISDIILKGRFLILILFIGIITLMIQFAKDVKLSYEVAKILPSDDQTYIDYEDFKSEFGESMNTIVIAVQDVDFFDKDHLKAWNSFGEDIESIEGIDRVINITQLPILATDSIKQKFIYNSWYHSDMTESEVENAVELLKDQKIYKGKFYNKDANSGIMLVDINKKVLASPQRKNVIEGVDNVLRDERSDGWESVHLFSQSIINLWQHGGLTRPVGWRCGISDGKIHR